MSRNGVAMWVARLRSGFNAFESAHWVEVFPSRAIDFVVITEGSSLAGGSPSQPSITNAAEAHCPQIAERLGLDWARCRFIECYPRDGSRLCPTYDEICFDPRPPRQVRDPTVPGRWVPVAKLASPGWKPLSLDLAEALRDAGAPIDGFSGYQGVFRSARGTQSRCRDEAAACGFIEDPD